MSSRKGNGTPELRRTRPKPRQIFIEKFPLLSDEDHAIAYAYGVWGEKSMYGEDSFPFEFGDAIDEEGLHSIGLERLYDFNTEGKYTPAFGISGALDFPVGNGSDGVDSTVKAIATHTLGWSSLQQRVYLNGAWMHNDDPLAHERDDLFQVVVGYGCMPGRTP